MGEVRLGGEARAAELSGGGGEEPIEPFGKAWGCGDKVPGSGGDGPLRAEFVR